jgi:hypothetical protein
MSGGKDKKAANKMMQQSAATEVSRGARFDERNQADLNASRGKGDELYGQMHSGYSSLLTPQDFSSGVPAASSGGGGGGGGGKVAKPGAKAGSGGDPRFKEVENAYRGFMGPNGGWDPARLASMNEDIAGFKEFARTGGIGADEQDRMRGRGIYEEFSKTGGLSDADRANIRSRATSVIPAMYQQMGDESNRMSSVQGGYGPGRAALQSRLARDQASGLSDATRDAELGIMEQVNEGRQWGTEGMTNSERDLQELLTRNKLTGLTGASSTTQGLQDSISRGRQYGISGVGSLAENQRQAEIQREQIAAQNRASGAASGAASAALQQRNKEWEAEFGLKRFSTGLEGLGSLYTSSPDEYMRNKAFDLENRGLATGAAGSLGQGVKAGMKDPWDVVGDVAGAAAGGIGSYFGGMAGGR